jgi:hypothetical protein
MSRVGRAATNQNREASFGVAARPTCAALDIHSAERTIGGAGLLRLPLPLQNLLALMLRCITFWMIIRLAFIAISHPDWANDNNRKPDPFSP